MDISLTPDGAGQTAEQPSSPSEQSASPAIGDVIDKLLAHPEIISMVASGIGLNNHNGQSTSAPKEAEAKPTAAPADPVSLPAAAIPDKGQDDPLLSKIPEVMATLAPMLGPMFSGGKSEGKPPPDDHRICLLRALKPYLSHGRGEAVDYIIQLSRISEMLKKLT